MKRGRKPKSPNDPRVRPSYGAEVVAEVLRRAAPCSHCGKRKTIAEIIDGLGISGSTAQLWINDGVRDVRAHGLEGETNR